MLNVKKIIENLPENIYSRSPKTRIATLLSAFLGAATNLEMRTLLTYFNLFLKTCRYDALDYIFGNIFGLPRLTEEKYNYRPLIDTLTPEQWMEVEAKDAKYRNRLIKFIEAANAEGIEMIKLAVLAATGYSADVYDQRDFGMGINDPLNDPHGYYEFIIVPHKPNWSERDSFVTKILVDRLKPSHLTYRIEPGVTKLQDISITNLKASSSYYQLNIEQNIYQITTEWDTDNKINGISDVSSELIIEEKYSRPGKSVKTPNAISRSEASGSPYVQRRIKYHSSSTVCWYGNANNVDTGPDIYGHKGIDAFDNNPSTYWLSVGNNSPTDGYAFEWLECEVLENGEGAGINEIWVKLPYPNMSMWISIMDKSGRWWDLGGGKIPYDPNHTASYPNGADIPYVFYTPNTGPADDPNDPNSWHKYFLGRWFPDTKYVRVTFHNLHYSGIGTYKYRAAVSEFRVYANLVDYYGGWRATNYTGDQVNEPWISQEVETQDSPDVWLKVILNKRQEINRIRIQRGSRAKNQIIKIKDENGNIIKNNVTLNNDSVTIAFDKRELSFFYIYPERMERLSILSDKYGLEIKKVEAWLEEFVEGESYTIARKPYPAENAIDNNPNTYWHTEYRTGSREKIEYIVCSLELDEPYNQQNKYFTKINRVAIWAKDMDMEYKIRYYEPVLENNKIIYIWRYADIDAATTKFNEGDYNIVLNFSQTVSAAAIEVQITKLASLFGGTKYAARIKDIKAWAHIKTYEEKKENFANYFYDWQIENIIDGKEDTLWRSEGSITPFDFEYINFTIPSSGGGIYGFYIDPEIPGSRCNIYYSNDEAENYEDKIWIPIYTDYWLEKGMMILPYVVNSRYWKLEFTNLMPQIYSYRIFGTETKIERRIEDPLMGNKVLEEKKEQYKLQEKIANLPLKYYIGIRELKAFKYDNLGKNPYEFTDSFNDLYYVNEEETTMIWVEDNFSLACSGDAVFQSKEFDLASDLKSISIIIDEKIPEGLTPKWYATRDGINWHPIDYIKNSANTWFVFPDSDAPARDKFALRCEVSGSSEKIYLLNQYTVYFSYFIEM